MAVKWLKNLWRLFLKSGCHPYVDIEDKGGGVVCEPEFFPGDNPNDSDKYKKDN